MQTSAPDTGAHALPLAFALAHSCQKFLLELEQLRAVGIVTNSSGSSCYKGELRENLVSFI